MFEKNLYTVETLTDLDMLNMLKKDKEMQKKFESDHIPPLLNTKDAYFEGRCGPK